MKNLFKFAFVVLVIGCIVCLFSCGEHGGTIIVRNNYSEDKTVTVYSHYSRNVIIFSYEDKYGPKTIPAGGIGNFNVNSDTEYGLVWRHDSSIDRDKVVKVSNGETIEVEIP